MEGRTWAFYDPWAVCCLRKVGVKCIGSCEKNNNVLVSLAKTIRKDREVKQGLLTEETMFY